MGKGIRRYEKFSSLESLILKDGKSRSDLFESILGSRPGGPTIITPEQYKSRFRRAIDSYFLLSPDVWMSENLTQEVKKGTGVDEFALP